MNLLEREAVRLTAMLAATENWSPYYSKTPKQHAALVNGQAEMQVVMTRFFRDMARRAGDFVNWDQYNYQSRLDYNVDVIVNDEQLESSDGTFIKINLKTVKNLIMAGALAGEENYGIPLGIPSTSEIIQQLTIKQVASLVGKKVQDDGSIIDNPDARYNILDTVRKDIAQSVKTSLGAGETTDEAIVRLQEIIGNPDRAELIAQTEAVNAYQAGVQQFGQMTGAVGKVWMSSTAKDICATYAAMGPVPFDYTYGPGLLGPTAHPRCMCARRLIYAEEWANIHS